MTTETTTRTAGQLTADLIATGMEPFATTFFCRSWDQFLAALDVADDWRELNDDTGHHVGVRARCGFHDVSVFVRRDLIPDAEATTAEIIVTKGLPEAITTRLARS